MPDESEYRQRGEYMSRISAPSPASPGNSTLDAIGANNDVLLVISCKGRVQTIDLEVGQFAAVRNAQTAAASDVTHWLQVVAQLSRDPKGDNYDFSRYRTIIGVVCTPLPLFILDATLRMRESAHDLPTLLSAEELAQLQFQTLKRQEVFTCELGLNDGQSALALSGANTYLAWLLQGGVRLPWI